MFIFFTFIYRTFGCVHEEAFLCADGVSLFQSLCFYLKVQIRDKKKENYLVTQEKSEHWSWCSSLPHGHESRHELSPSQPLTCVTWTAEAWVRSGQLNKVPREDLLVHLVWSGLSGPQQPLANTWQCGWSGQGPGRMLCLYPVQPFQQKCLCWCSLEENHGTKNNFSAWILRVPWGGKENLKRCGLSVARYVLL